MGSGSPPDPNIYYRTIIYPSPPEKGGDFFVKTYGKK
jgi:hypothetical protein